MNGKDNEQVISTNSTTTIVMHVEETKRVQSKH